MLKRIYLLALLIFLQPLAANGRQDTTAQKSSQVDSSAVRVLTADSSDTTSQLKTQERVAKADSLRRQSDTIGVALRRLKPDSASTLQAASTTRADSATRETPTAAPQRDTTTAPAPALIPVQPETVARAETTFALPSDTGKKKIETLPETISEEAQSAEKTILHQLESVVKIFSLARLILTIIVLALTYFAVKIMTTLLARIVTRRARLAPRLRKFIPLVTFGFWFLAFYFIIVGIFARSPLSILIILGVLALALGIASHQLLRDLVGGLVILLERPFHLGDRVRIGEHAGEVIKIGLRAFHLASAGGEVIVVPNAEIMRQAIANSNPGAVESQVTAELLLPAEVEIETAKKIAFEAAAVSPYFYSRRPITVQVDEEYKSELLTKIIVKAYVFDVRYEQELRSGIIETARRGLQQRDAR